jgi:predicted HicB family RNase H-like nuclease
MLQHIDFRYYLNYNHIMSAKIGRPRTGRWPNISIRINPVVLQRARDAAVSQKKTLGKWLEEAILEKTEREELNEEGGK